MHRVTTPVLTRTCVSISAADSEELTELYEYAKPIRRMSGPTPGRR